MNNFELSKRNGKNLKYANLTNFNKNQSTHLVFRASKRRQTDIISKNTIFHSGSLKMDICPKTLYPFFILPIIFSAYIWESKKKAQLTQFWHIFPCLKYSFGANLMLVSHCFYDLYDRILFISQFVAMRWRWMWVDDLNGSVNTFQSNWFYREINVNSWQFRFLSLLYIFTLKQRCCI